MRWPRWPNAHAGRAVCLLQRRLSGAPARANRVVLTATDVHKASFKCQYPGEYTFFADALFNQAGAERLSITQWMGAAQKSIQAQGKAQAPGVIGAQDVCGEEAKAWASQPLKSWLQAR